ncbi:MAG: dihydrolipoyl dehydrogenase family protein [Solirubrobacterales bacterium]
MRRYDLAVIGAGAGGLVAALTAGRLGARVALIERGRVGGDCTWTGCVPSKTLIASARRVHAIRTAGELGIEAGDPTVDFPAVMARVHSTIDRIAETEVTDLDEAGVELIRGSARFTGPGELHVDGRGTLRWRKAIIATGSTALVPPIDGLDTVDPLTNETIFQLSELPPRLTVVGGGAIGLELGQAFARLGSEVTIIEQADRVASREDADASVVVRRALEADGVTIHTSATAERFTSSSGDGAGTVHASTADGAEIDVEFDRVVITIGRKPVTDGLDVSVAGVETDSGAVVVDERLRTANPHVYAAGDCIAKLQFTHVAGYHGAIAATNALLRLPTKVDHDPIPWATFTEPEMAQVGLTEQAAREAHDDVVVYRHDLADSDRAITEGAEAGFAKVVTTGRGRTIVGATVVGPTAGETIAELALAMREGKSATAMASVVHAYPTFSEAVPQAALGALSEKAPLARRILRPVLAGLRVIDRPR